MDRMTELYKNHARMPYISPDRDLDSWLLDPKTVPKRNMEDLGDGLLAGDIILLWRIGFDTFTTNSPFPKYFEYTYGINGPEHLQALLAAGYANEEAAFDSLDHLSSNQKKSILKSKGVTGLSKMKATDLDKALADHFSEDVLAEAFAVRGYKLTDKGRQTLDRHADVISRHPQKKL